MKRLLSAALLLCAAAPAAAADLTFSAIKVNGATIPASRVQIDLGGRLQTSQMLHGASPGGVAEAKRVNPVVDKLIVRELLLQEARRRGLAVSEAELAAAWEAERSRWGGGEKFAKSLEFRGVTADYLRERIAEDLLLHTLVRELDAGLLVTEQDERAFHAANPGRFRAPGDPRLRCLYIDNAKHGGPEGAARRYQEFRQRLDEGEPFAKLIEEFSDHPTAAGGGLIGEDPDPALPFLDQAHALRPAQFTHPPPANARGIYCYYRDHDPPTLPYEQVREKVRATLLAQRRKERLDGLVRDLRAAARIEFVPK